MPAKFTSGQYKQMAEIIKDMKPYPATTQDGVTDTVATVYWKSFTRAFCKGLRKLNPKVKPSMFYKACDCEEIL